MSLMSRPIPLPRFSFFHYSQLIFSNQIYNKYTLIKQKKHKAKALSSLYPFPLKSVFLTLFIPIYLKSKLRLSPNYYIIASPLNN